MNVVLEYVCGCVDMDVEEGWNFGALTASFDRRKKLRMSILTTKYAHVRESVRKVVFNLFAAAAAVL